MIRDTETIYAAAHVRYSDKCICYYIYFYLFIFIYLFIYLFIIYNL